MHETWLSNNQLNSHTWLVNNTQNKAISCKHVRVTQKGTLTHTIHGTGIESHEMNML